MKFSSTTVCYMVELVQLGGSRPHMIPSIQDGPVRRLGLCRHDVGGGVRVEDGRRILHRRIAQDRNDI